MVPVMRMPAVSRALGLALASSACADPTTFVCQTDEQCVVQRIPGICEAEGVCSFPDPACPSGQRYGESAGPLSGECVEDETTGPTSVATTLLMGSGSPTPTTGTPTGTSPTSVGLTDALDSSTSAPGPTGTSEGGDSTSTTAAGPQPQGPYGECQDDGDCTESGAICMSPIGLSVCAPPCDAPEGCPPVPDGTAQPQCMPLPPGAGCLLDCEGGAACPTGMECTSMFGVGFCHWP